MTGLTEPPPPRPSSARRPLQVAIIGDRDGGSEPQVAIAPAIEHAAAVLGVDCTTSWVPTEELARDAAAMLAGCDAVWGAPGSPFRSFEGMLAGIGWAREQRVPFLGTCAGFQHGVIEFARSVLGIAGAHHEEVDPDASELVVTGLLCSLYGQVMPVRLVDPELRAMYGAEAVEERYYCTFGLNPQYRDPLERAGLRVCGVDATDGEPRILRLADHRFFVLTLFVPQTASTARRPHPVVQAFVAATAAAANEAEALPA